MTPALFESMQRGWGFTKASLHIIRRNPRILVFPSIAAGAGLAISGSFLAGAFVVAGGSTVEAVLSGLALAAARYVSYWAGYLIVLVFNAGVVDFAIRTLGGSTPRLSESLNVMRRNLRRLLAWATIAALVAVLIRFGEAEVGPPLRYVLALLGFGWTFAVPLVIPVMIYESLGPWKALRRSMEIRRRTFGESMGGMVSLYGGFILAATLGILPLAIGFILGGLIGFVFGLVLAVAYWVALFVIGSTAKAILVATIYEYAAKGRLPREFENLSLRGIVRTRNVPPPRSRE